MSRAAGGSGAAPDLGFQHRFVPDGGAGFTLLLLHGTGGSEDDLLPLGRLLAPGAALLSPRGQVLEHGMSRYFRRLAEGVFDVEDLLRRTHELAGFVRGACAHYALDPRRIIATGYSNGANIAASLLMVEPGTLAGAVLLRPMVPLTPPGPPDLAGVGVFISAGRDDPYSRDADQLARMLSEYGAAVELRWQSAGHGLERVDVDQARDWIASHPLAR